ncbi:hypothetical protein E2C01_028184 [Portunus trituberculatus]|uniref:Uncharacterized protein n=1 Tax=Portunus trituberculatus TaxID=210409 RepID=A0A5B7EKP1_PORTR|nr:hypothetical protein [Portunus trituberculatus]
MFLVTTSLNISSHYTPPGTSRPHATTPRHASTATTLHSPHCDTPLAPRTVWHSENSLLHSLTTCVTTPPLYTARSTTCAPVCPSLCRTI